nr:MAG TPA: hypothetical protein [Caudoviricetes sp.]
MRGINLPLYYFVCKLCLQIREFYYYCTMHIFASIINYKI